MVVDAVWGEPVSTEFPVMQGKYRENFRKLGVISVGIFLNARRTVAFIAAIIRDMRAPLKMLILRKFHTSTY